MHIISVGHLNELYVDGAPLGTYLTRKEEELLRAVLSHSHVASKEFLLTSLYQGMDEPLIKIIDVFITKVRAKLGPHRIAMVTVWGRGYARHPDYSIAPRDLPLIAIGVDAKLVEEVVFACGKQPDAIIARLLQAERDRLWSEAA
jgi:hypothetical protein